MQDQRIVADYNAQAGWAVVGGKRCYFRSKLELRAAQYYEFLKQAGEINDWEYEPHTFWFNGVRRGVTSYKPDFKIWKAGVTVSPETKPYFWAEWKGHLHQKDVTKFKRMAKYYPDEEFVLMMQAMTKKNKLRRDNAARYVKRVVDGGAILRKLGL